MTIYANPGTDGSVMSYEKRYDNFIGGQWVPPVDGQYMDNVTPVTGEVVTINEAAVDSPGLLNSDPYGEGWLFEVAVTEVGEVMDAAGYAEANSL